MCEREIKKQIRKFAVLESTRLCLYDKRKNNIYLQCGGVEPIIKLWILKEILLKHIFFWWKICYSVVLLWKLSLCLYNWLKFICTRIYTLICLFFFHDTRPVTGHHLFCEFCLAVSQRFNLNKFERAHITMLAIKLNWVIVNIHIFE